MERKGTPRLPAQKGDSPPQSIPTPQDEGGSPSAVATSSNRPKRSSLRKRDEQQIITSLSSPPPPPTLSSESSTPPDIRRPTKGTPLPSPRPSVRTSPTSQLSENQIANKSSESRPPPNGKSRGSVTSERSRQRPVTTDPLTLSIGRLEEIEKTFFADAKPRKESESWDIETFVRKDLVKDLEGRIKRLENFLNKPPHSELGVGLSLDPNVKSIPKEVEELLKLGLDNTKGKTKETTGICVYPVSDSPYSHVDAAQKTQLSDLAGRLKQSKPDVDPFWIDKVVKELSDQHTQLQQLQWLVRQTRQQIGRGIVTFDGAVQALQSMLEGSGSAAELQEAAIMIDAKKNFVLENENRIKKIADDCQLIANSRREISSKGLPDETKRNELLGRLNILAKDAAQLSIKSESLDNKLMQIAQTLAESNALFTSLAFNITLTVDPVTK